MKAPINKRLLVCSELVRAGAVLADIGTDHAYLPIYLLERGIIERAVLSDINQGPLNKARENSEKAGFIHKVELRLCNGASELSECGATDYAICGMGGELIADIIEHAPHLKNKNINLILQPMSRQEKLRQYLYSAGFRIISESYSVDAGKRYVCMLATFDGKSREISDLEATAGAKDVEFIGRDHRIAYLEAKLSSIERAYAGRSESGLVSDADGRLVTELKELILQIKGENK